MDGREWRGKADALIKKNLAARPRFDYENCGHVTGVTPTYQCVLYNLPDLDYRDYFVPGYDDSDEPDEIIIADNRDLNTAANPEMSSIMAINNTPAGINFYGKDDKKFECGLTGDKFLLKQFRELQRDVLAAQELFDDSNLQDAKVLESREVICRGLLSRWQVLTCGDDAKANQIRFAMENAAVLDVDNQGSVLNYLSLGCQAHEHMHMRNLYNLGAPGFCSRFMPDENYINEAFAGMIRDGVMQYISDFNAPVPRSSTASMVLDGLVISRVASMQDAAKPQEFKLDLAMLGFDSVIPNFNHTGNAKLQPDFMNISPVGYEASRQAYESHTKAFRERVMSGAAFMQRVDAAAKTAKPISRLPSNPGRCVSDLNSAYENLEQPGSDGIDLVKP